MIVLRTLSFIVLFWLNLIKADNNCRIDKVEIPVYPSRIILTFECYSGINSNPDIPIDNGSGQSEYNELDLSPNLYTHIPIHQVCKFVNIYILDLSYNKIKNITNVFVDLKCLKSLKNFDLSSNLIETPLRASDFDSDFTTHLEFLSLKFNRIPSIESRAFFKDDGTSAFPNLSYLDLSYNELKILDLAWPMSLPYRSLKIMLAYNKITTFANKLNISYNNIHLADMVGNRSVDVTHNLISRFDDSNLLQYSLKSSYDFGRFLEKLSNFDFRTNRLYCICPETSGLYSVHWFKQFSAFIKHPNSPIYQLVCTNSPSNSVFNFTCPFMTKTETKLYTSLMPVKPSLSTVLPTTTSTTSTTTASTTTTSTTSTTTTTTSTTTTTTSTTTNSTTKTYLAPIHQVLIASSASSLPKNPPPPQLPLNTGTYNAELKNFVDETLSEFDTSTLQSEIETRYSFLVFWFTLPLFPIIFLVLFLYCNFRAILISMQQRLGINLCGWLRSHELQEPFDSNKYYDATICYSLYDQSWFEESFLPTFSDYIRGYKINKLGLNYSQSNSMPVNISHVDCMRSSKRIVLLLSEKFISNVWSNRKFADVLRSLCHSDETCVVLLVNICSQDSPNRVYIKNQVQHIRDLLYFDEGKSSGAWSKLKYRVTHSFSLNQVESLDWDHTKFWSELLYLMPLSKNALQSSSSLSQYSKRHMDSPLSIIVDSTKPKHTEHDFQLTHKIINNNTSTEGTKLPRLFDKSSSDSGTPTGFTEKGQFWTRYESAKTLETQMDSEKSVRKSARGLLENILNFKNQSPLESESDSGEIEYTQLKETTSTQRSKALGFREAIDISITNEDLYTVEHEVAPKPLSKRRRRMMKRKKRIEALEDAYNIKGVIKNF